MNTRFSIKNIEPVEPLRMVITFGDDATMNIDMNKLISRYPVLQPLKDPSLFLKARVDGFGRNVVWSDDIELAGDNLRAEAVEQCGGISHERIWNWMHRNNLTLDAAAEALGMSRRMLVYYRNGDKPVPKHVWLACLGWEHSISEGEGLFEKAA